MSLETLAAHLAASRAFAHKADIAPAASLLGVGAGSAMPVGDDCAVIADGDGFLLFAIEGFLQGFVAQDPRFAGWCGVMVSVSDVAAMGGWPIAVVDALWSEDAAASVPILQGLRAASEAYGVPIVGGHTNARAAAPGLAIAVLGRARQLLTSFDARPGDVLVAAIDLRGTFRAGTLHWDAASGAPAARLRGDLALLPAIAASALARAAKDISNAGLAGTAAMLAGCSGVGVAIEPRRVPRPPGVATRDWLLAFPSFGFLLACPRASTDEVVARFETRGIAAAAIGVIERGTAVRLVDGDESALVIDFARHKLLGMTRARADA